MRAYIKNIEVEGTPQEVFEFSKLIKKDLKKRKARSDKGKKRKSR